LPCVKEKGKLRRRTEILREAFYTDENEVIKKLSDGEREGLKRS